MRAGDCGHAGIFNEVVAERQVMNRLILTVICLDNGWISQFTRRHYVKLYGAREVGSFPVVGNA